MAITKIEWANFTMNPVRGCVEVSPACQNCYARVLSERNPKTLGRWGTEKAGGVRVMAAEKSWLEPYKWNTWARLGKCFACGGRGMLRVRDELAGGTVTHLVACATCAGDGQVEPYRGRVFCASLADIFEQWDGPIHDHKETVLPGVTFDSIRSRLLKVIDETPHLDWLLLTKRTADVADTLRRMAQKSNDARAARWINEAFPKNVWMGTTVESTEWALKRIPFLVTLPAAVRFLSVEPLLDELDLANSLGYWKRQPCSHHMPRFNLECPLCSGDNKAIFTPNIHWVIAGGESGHNARPMDPRWLRRVRDQCKAVGVAFFFKQFGEYAPTDTPDLLNDIRFGHEWVTWKGKHAAGRLLDGVEYSEFPKSPLEVLA